MRSALSYICISALALCLAAPAMAQKSKEKADIAVPDITSVPDTTGTAKNVTGTAEDSVMAIDMGKILPLKKKRDWSTWKPDTKRAMWLAIVLPGAGQIYNRKYWKLPIIYGGFVGCAYAITWNNQMYHDYSQAYMDIMDNDPNTQSYNQFLHLGTVINSSNEERYKDIFKKRKDKYRRWRDMGMFVMIGIYALSIIDAYVDASLSQFDISDDLTLHIEPTFLKAPQSNSLLQSGGLGLQCSLTF